MGPWCLKYAALPFFWDTQYSLGISFWFVLCRLCFRFWFLGGGVFAVACFLLSAALSKEIKHSGLRFSRYRYHLAGLLGNWHLALVFAQFGILFV